MLDRAGERVRLRVSREGNRALSLLSDSGPGLPEEMLEKVFEPFLREEGSRFQETGGSGLGLAIARNLLRRQGGRVWLENLSGRGLKAVVTLPCREVTPALPKS